MQQSQHLLRRTSRGWFDIAHSTLHKKTVSYSGTVFR
jgi:hypothetical protein